MNPMFKQIKAFEVSTLLDQLELKNLDLTEIQNIVLDLKNKIKLLFILLEKE